MFFRSAQTTGIKGNKTYKQTQIAEADCARQPSSAARAARAARVTAFWWIYLSVCFKKPLLLLGNYNTHKVKKVAVVSARGRKRCGSNNTHFWLFLQTGSSSSSGQTPEGSLTLAHPARRTTCMSIVWSTLPSNHTFPVVQIYRNTRWFCTSCALCCNVKLLFVCNLEDFKSWWNCSASVRIKGVIYWGGMAF